MAPKWLAWAREIQAIAQSGLAFTQDQFDRERYERLRELASEIFAEHSNTPAEKIVKLFAEQCGYATPKVDVRGAVFRENRILLVREIHDGLWTLPGGWADVNESPASSVEREILEESGFQTRAMKIAAVWDRDRHGHDPHPFYSYKLFFLCELTGGTAQHSIETDGVNFFALDALPPLSLSRITPAQIRRMFEHHQNPALPTDFD